MQVDTILHGDAQEILKTLPAESVDMIITSPPYYNQRDYNTDGQLGMEKTQEEYIKNLCSIFDEAKRVLKKTGTCWVNIGDSYGSNWRGGGIESASKKQLSNRGTQAFMGKRGTSNRGLLQTPARFAIEMSNRGWLLINEICWVKPDAMPTSSKRRFTHNFEKLYFFTKNKEYYFQQQFEPLAKSTKNRNKYPHKGGGVAAVSRKRNPGEFGDENKGRNKRAIWTIPTNKINRNHIAVYPEELIEYPIRAGSPENGLVLDPFIGSGTTAVVAKRLGRHYLGIEINEEYIKAANNRVAADDKSI